MHGRGPALRSTCKRLGHRVKTSRRRSTAPRPVVQWKFTQTAWPAPMIRLRRGIIGNPLTKPWPDPSWSSRPMPGRDHLAPPAGIAPAGSATGRARDVAPIAAAPTILKTCRQTSGNSFGPVPSQSSAPQQDRVTTRKKHRLLFYHSHSETARKRCDEFVLFPLVAHSLISYVLNAIIEPRYQE